MKRFARYATGGFSVLTAWALAEPHFLRVRRFHVATKNLPPEADGMRIVQLSDFHLSAISSPKIVRRAVELANAQKPDVLVLTGDLVSRENSYAPFLVASLWAKTPREYAVQIAPILGRLRASLGVFSVHGNHDNSPNADSSNDNNPNGFAFLDRLLERNGVRVLTNSSTRLRGLPLVGLDDLRSGRIRWRQAFDGVSGDEAQIVLSHNPRVLPFLKHRNALILSGHTHGGQARVPVKFRHRPFDMKSSLYHDGWYHDEMARMWVSVGIGSVNLPLRFFCPPEITVLTLKKEDDSHHNCQHEHDHPHTATTERFDLELAPHAGKPAVLRRRR